MHQPMSNPYPPDAQVELARERNRIAADRSLLSFVRNSVTLISTGIGIEQVIQLLNPAVAHVKAWIYLLSLTLVGLGVVNLVFAALDYKGELQRLRQPEYHFTPRWSLSSASGWVLFGVGLLAFLRLGVRLLP